MKWRVATWFTVLCVGLGCPPALAETPPAITIGALVAQPQDLAGFGPAVQAARREVTYALEWALAGEHGISAVEREAKVLEQWALKPE